MSPNLVALLYLASGVLFIMALRGLSSPESSRAGNTYGMIGMAIAILTTLGQLGALNSPLTWLLILAGLGVGGGIGAYTARQIPMTMMPELVAAFHSLVGLAAVFVAAAALYAPHSRGEVTLTAPDRPPRIDFRMLSDPRDPPRLLAAARFAEQLIRDPAMAGTFSEAFLMPPLMSLNQFNRPGLAGALLGLGAKAVLNAPAPIRRRVLERLLRPGRWFADRSRRLPLSDAELLGAAASMAHPVGTCAIGRPDDPMAVVDPSCRVYGVGNLRVVDASIMPRIPCANTNLPTLMIAHRAADLIRARA